MAAAEVAGLNLQGAEEHRVRVVGHAVGQHPRGGSIDRGQAGRAGDREVADDVEFRALVQGEAGGGLDEPGPVQCGPPAGSEDLAEPVPRGRQQPERQP